MGSGDPTSCFCPCPCVPVSLCPCVPALQHASEAGNTTLCHAGLADASAALCCMQACHLQGLGMLSSSAVPAACSAISAHGAQTAPDRRAHGLADAQATQAVRGLTLGTMPACLLQGCMPSSRRSAGCTRRLQCPDMGMHQCRADGSMKIDLRMGQPSCH